jgi:hypothetical protein
MLLLFLFRAGEMPINKGIPELEISSRCWRSGATAIREDAMGLPQNSPGWRRGMISEWE